MYKDRRFAKVVKKQLALSEADMEEINECEQYFSQMSQATMMRELLLEKVREINTREKRRKEFKAELEQAAQEPATISRHEMFRPRLVA